MEEAMINPLKRIDEADSEPKSAVRVVIVYLCALSAMLAVIVAFGLLIEFHPVLGIGVLLGILYRIVKWAAS
jgi:hypothetical protein